VAAKRTSEATGAMIDQADRKSIGHGPHTSMLLSNHRLYETRSLDEARDKLNRSLVPHALDCRSAPGQFECIHNAITLQDVTINAIFYGASVSVDMPDIQDNLFLVLVIRGSCHIESGTQSFDVRAGEMFVINAEQPFYAQISQDFEEIVVGIDTKAVGPAMLRLVDRPTSVPLRFDLRPLTAEGPPGSLVRFLRLLCLEMDAERSALDNKLMMGRYEQTLLSLILTTLPHNYSDWIEQGVPAAVPYYVHRAERFIRANLEAAVTLDSIVASSGVGMRSLHHGFRQFRQMTPMGFLKECRLQRVRDQLRSSATIGQPINRIARDSGFEHPSKFTQAYKDRFAELPSETRRRAAY
jgi:AraC-like DNA-binding protein/mannose-6-phosphate isomerase-like protein (cupin superfamily)